MKPKNSILWVLFFGLVLSLGAGACGVDASSLEEVTTTTTSASAQAEATPADKALPQTKAQSLGGGEESLCVSTCLNDSDCSACSALHGGCYLAVCVACRPLGVTCRGDAQCCGGRCSTSLGRCTL